MTPDGVGAARAVSPDDDWDAFKGAQVFGVEERVVGERLVNAIGLFLMSAGRGLDVCMALASREHSKRTVATWAVPAFTRARTEAQVIATRILAAVSVMI